MSILTDPVVLDVDLVDQAEFVDVGGDFRIVDRLQRRDDVVGQPRQFVGREWPRPKPYPCAATSISRRCSRLDSVIHDPHPKNLRAFSSASAKASTSALVLYMPNDALHVEVTPKRFNSGWAQCVPARTATPWRSITIETSWA
jgi:hypothetical protein